MVAQRPGLGGEFLAIAEAIRALFFRRIMVDGGPSRSCADSLPDFDPAWREAGASRLDTLSKIAQHGVWTSPRRRR